MKRTIWIIASVLGSFMLCCCGGLGEPLFVFVFGWAIYPVITFPKMTVEPAALVVGGVSFVLFIAIVHGFAGWLYAHCHREQSPRSAWQLRWSAAISGVVVLLFGTGICLIVVVHQFAWLVTSDKPLLHNSNPRTRSWSRMFAIGRAVDSYLEDNHQYPPGSLFDRYGVPLHSWETMLLPYSENWEYFPEKTLLKPDMEAPWNDPRNADCFKAAVPTFLNPGVDGPRHDSNNFGLSHYAANAHVLGPRPPMRREDITDGLANTIMAGEVKENFRPWGDPLNFRDPAEGVQKSPHGFGGPWFDGSTQFLMMDGSVRQVSKDIDPAVLKALATPRGGEKVPDNFDQ